MDADGTIIAALTAIAGLAMLSLAALRMWAGWLELRREQIERFGRRGRVHGGGGRLDIADLRNRVRRLEAIADGAED